MLASQITAQRPHPLELDAQPAISLLERVIDMQYAALTQLKFRIRAIAPYPLQPLQGDL